MKNISSLRRFLCLGVTLGGLAASPALADPAGNWTGPYVGAFGGGTWSEFRNGTGDDDSFTGGADVGNNWQFGHMVVGAEADFTKLDNHTGSNGVKFDEDWLTTARGRVGYAIDRFLPYVTGGLAMTDTTAKVSGVGTDETVMTGYAVGAGVDTQLAGNWFGRVEYLYDDVPTNSTTLGGTTVNSGSGNHNLRVGVDYKF